MLANCRQHFSPDPVSPLEAVYCRMLEFTVFEKPRACVLPTTTRGCTELDVEGLITEHPKSEKPPAAKVLISGCVKLEDKVVTCVLMKLIRVEVIETAGTVLSEP